MRKSLLHILQAAPAAFSISRLKSMTGQRFVLPFYHSIQGSEDLPHIRHLYYPRSTKQFEADLDLFLSEYQPIGLETLIDSVQNETELPKDAFFLSFDDGLREVYDIAAPILKRKGIPATIFLNSSFVDNKALFFRYKVSVLIETMNKQKLTKGQTAQLGKMLSLNSPEKALIEEDLLKLNYSQRQLPDELAAVIELDFDAFLKKQKPYLTTPQIRELKKDGFAIGGHSVDHPLFAEINLAEQIRQTERSVDFVKRRFKTDYRTFSFPFTDHEVGATFFETMEEDKITDITFGSAGIKEDSFTTHFQRIPMEEFTTSAEEILRGEYLYYLLKAPIGKNFIDRG